MPNVIIDTIIPFRQKLNAHDKMPGMNKLFNISISILFLFAAGNLSAVKDSRQLVVLPEMIQQHMMANMRDHLSAINEILAKLANSNTDQAAEIAETRLGMSSLTSHGASHMAEFMPQGMRQAGTNMHRAASRFALKAQEGDILSTYNALSAVTSACVVCHNRYRIR